MTFISLTINASRVEIIIQFTHARIRQFGTEGVKTDTLDPAFTLQSIGHSFAFRV